MSSDLFSDRIYAGESALRWTGPTPFLRIPPALDNTSPMLKFVACHVANPRPHERIRSVQRE